MGTASGCRDRIRQVLLRLEETGPVPLEVLQTEISATSCTAEHPLQLADLDAGLLTAESGGLITITPASRDWLLEADRPSPNWAATIALGTPPLRAWQSEALEAWCHHGRHGVIEAVTGTGKSRVGVEAAREALRHDYNVIVMVPTVDLVEQWVKALVKSGVAGVGALGDGKKASFRTHRVIVGTVQSLYLNPPLRADGKVLLIADECHRYGAGQWRHALHASYRRRLGLTATFERNDDGLESLLAYFGGDPVFRIGFRRAIDDDVVAHYDVQLLGVPLNARERAEYDEADKIARDARLQLLAADFPAEPFGAFLHEVQKAAEDDLDPTIADVARRYLKAFSRRIDVMTNADAKLKVASRLAPRINASGGALVFTRRVEMAEELADTLVEGGVKAAAIHSDLTKTERKDRLAALRAGRMKALVAPTILDEGIDVPDIDLAIVMGGSRSRRQMIQRMGRVLRLKADGRKATFVVVFATGTAEDLTDADGAEGCLDLIVETADSVEPLALDGDRVLPSELVLSRRVDPAKKEEEETITDAAPRALIDCIDVSTHPLSATALRQYGRAHGASRDEATSALRRLLHDLRLRGVVRDSQRRSGVQVISSHGFELAVSAEEVAAYRSLRDDACTWDDLTHDPGRPAPTLRGDEPSAADAFDPTPMIEQVVDEPDPAPSAVPMTAVDSMCPLAPEPAPDSLVTQLERLASLRKDGFLTDDEFREAKSRLLR
ncbi:DEAD/DEAH box helicase family protein [Nocardioides ultimimeridianus]